MLINSYFVVGIVIYNVMWWAREQAVGNHPMA